MSVIVLIIFEEVLGPDLNNTFVPVVSTFIGYVSELADGNGVTVLFICSYNGIMKVKLESSLLVFLYMLCNVFASL